MRVTVHASYIIRIIPITFKFIHNALLVYQWGFCFRDVKINWCDRERIETKFFFASFLVAAWFFCKGDGRTEFKISIDFIYPISLFISVLLYYKSHLRQTCHHYSRARYVLHVHVFCSQCFVIKFYPFPVRCLKYTSWKVVTDGITYFTSISSEISSWMSKEMSRTKSSKNFSRHTSTSFSHQLFVCRWT